MPEKLIMIAFTPYELEILINTLLARIEHRREIMAKLKKDGHTELVEINRELIRNYQELLSKLKERRIQHNEV